MYKPLTIEDVNKKLKPVLINTDVSYLSENQLQVIKYLVKVVDIIRDLYFFQKNKHSKELINRLKTENKLELLQLVHIFNDTYNQFDDSYFIENTERSAVSSFYPEDITVEEWNNFLELHPELKESFISPFTVIERNKKQELCAIPYSEAYKAYLGKAAALLYKASEYADNFYLKSYLHAQANAFTGDDYNEANIRWIQLSDNNVEPLIGPHELYDDTFLGYKASFTAFICINNKKEHLKLNELLKMANTIQSILPVPVHYKKSNSEKSSTMLIVDLIYSSGDGSGPIHTAAFNLPNSQKIRSEFGSKKVFLKNIIQAKFDGVMTEIGALVLSETDKNKVTFASYFNHILLHEISHSLGIGLIKDDNGAYFDVSYYLKELYSIIEETKSDAMGLFAQFYLVKQCVIIDTNFIESAYTYIVSIIRAIRFGKDNAHGISSLLQWNYLVKDGAVIVNQESLKITINLHKIEKSIEKYLTVILTIQGEGNYAKARDFINEYSYTDEILLTILNVVKDTPIDVLPVFKYGSEELNK